MWHLSKAAKEQFTKKNLLPIHNSDAVWEMALSAAKEEEEDLLASLEEHLHVVKDELLDVLPERFMPYLEDGTLNQPTLPKRVREDYLEWVEEADQEFEQILHAVYERKQAALPFLVDAVQDVFQESFHDGTIERIERSGETLHLYINLDHGFSEMSLIHLILKDMTSEVADPPIQVGQYFVYDELQKTAAGFAFRVLFDCPESEWTITMGDLDARYFYRPKEYTRLRDEEKLEETSLAEYMATLNGASRYWLITPDVCCLIKSSPSGLLIEEGTIEVGQHELVITVENERYSYKITEYNPINFIHTDVFEDPYAEFNKPVPMEELETAALSDNLELQVRAWNTMYAHPEAFADIINRVLEEMEIDENNEMMLSIYVAHFDQADILTASITQKYGMFID